MSITNATRLSDFAAGIGTEGAILKIDNANQRVGIGTQLPSHMLEVAGIVTATAFYGDGSNLEGITSAGLGTAISDVDGSAGAVIYYTDDLLTVTETTTVNPPASASAAYTQYRDVKLNDSVDLIIETGDDFIPDVLGLGTDASDPTLSGNGVFDEVYTDIIKNKNGLGAPTFANGLTSVGVITATGGFSGNVTGDLTGNVNNSTNLSLKTGGNEKLRITSSGLVGIGTELPGGKVTVAGISASARLELKRTNTNTTGAIGAINWTALDGHSVANMYALGDGDDEGAHLVFKTTSAAASNDPFNAATVERLRIGSAGQLGIGGANYGSSGQVLTSQGASAAPQWASASGGIEEYDEWTVTADSTRTGWNNAVVGSNSNNAAYGNTVAVATMTTTQNPLFAKIGTGMSFDVSTGVWTFPATGYWQVNFVPQINTDGASVNNWYVSATTDGGTTWKGGAEGTGDGNGIYASNNRTSYGAGTYTFNIPVYMNITNTTNQKIRFVYSTNGNVYFKGSTVLPETKWFFKKIA